MIRPKETEITSQVLKGCIAEHLEGVGRLSKLKQYYKTDHDILRRTKQNPLASNNRLAVPNPFYITTVANGFTFANPIAYKSAGNIDSLLDEMKLAKIASHDAEMGEDLSIYGRAYELVYMSEVPSRHVKLKNLSPENTFVVYSNEIDPQPMFGVYYCKKITEDGTADGYLINVYDGRECRLWTCKSLDALPVMDESMSNEHYAGQMPIVEYLNNGEGIGDFERVLTLIDAYDRLQSDRIDDKDQFVDAIMAVYGASLTELPEQMAEAVKNLRIYKIIDGLPQDARVEYLKKALDESGVETLRQALKQDISKFSMVPELTDESFAGTASGVAMEYKTLGLKWLCNMKRRMFGKGLDRRLQIMNSYMSKLGRGFDTTDIDAVFDSALPINKDALLPYAQDALSRKTMIANLSAPFGVRDIEEELRAVQEEKQQEAQINRYALDGGSFGQGDKT